MASLDLAGVITRVCTDLKAKFAPLSHTHGVEDLPTGTTATTVALGNHTHSGYASSSHSHGSISNGGAITSDTTVASGDKLLITDSSDSNKIKRSGIAFGLSTSTFLRNDGTWAEAGGGGGGSTLTLYTNDLTAIYFDSTYTTPFDVEYFDYDNDAEWAALCEPDVINIVYSSGGFRAVCPVVSRFRDRAEDGAALYFFYKSNVKVAYV